MQYKVLIVEDDPMVCMINENYVKRNPKFVVAGTARNGNDALKFLETNDVDLIILDVFMPYMDGIETLKKIREQKINAEVIMVTAANDTATVEETMHLGVIDFLIKPFALERFEVALEKFDSKVSAFENTNESVDQNWIDKLISGNGGAKGGKSEKNEENVLPKGIQEKTLSLILDFMKENKNWQSGDMLSEKLGLSIVTIRHYMAYLVKKGQIKQDIDYETGGRPCMLYKFCEKD